MTERRRDRETRRRIDRAAERKDKETPIHRDRQTEVTEETAIRKSSDIERRGNGEKTDR